MNAPDESPDADQWRTTDEMSPNLVAPSSDHRQQVGRYRIKKVLGDGGFGRVYLAHDDELRRFVAIKVPHKKLVARPEHAEAYRIAARTVANLDHPNIVPVYDVGSAEDCPCFIVSKYIEGSTLARKIREDRPSAFEAAELMATVAETLHYAHRTGLVHRDIKPGTPTYMSPKQARGEGRRVDGRAV
jgi:eukaryotic-like serine/threonine-protein kinase